MLANFKDSKPCAALREVDGSFGIRGNERATLIITFGAIH